MPGWERSPKKGKGSPPERRRDKKAPKKGDTKAVRKEKKVCTIRSRGVRQSFPRKKKRKWCPAGGGGGGGNRTGGGRKEKRKAHDVGRVKGRGVRKMCRGGEKIARPHKTFCPGGRTSHLPGG